MGTVKKLFMVGTVKKKENKFLGNPSFIDCFLVQFYLTIFFVKKSIVSKII